MPSHILSIVLFTPLVGLLVLLLIPGENKFLIRLWANIVAAAGFLVSLPLVLGFDRAKDGYQLDVYKRQKSSGRPTARRSGRASSPWSA